MGKLKNVTTQDLRDAEEKHNDGVMWDLANRLEKGYGEHIERPLELAQAYLSISRAAAEVASKLLVTSAMQEQRAELERLIAEKQKGG